MRRFEKEAEELFRIASNNLLIDGHVMQQGFMLTEEAFGLIMIPGEFWQNSEVRAQTGTAICELAREKNAQAVFIISEIWRLEGNDEEEIKEAAKDTLANHQDSTEHLVLFYQEADGTFGLLTSKIYRTDNKPYVRPGEAKWEDGLQEMRQGILHPWKTSDKPTDMEAVAEAFAKFKKRIDKREQQHKESLERLKTLVDKAPENIRNEVKSFIDTILSIFKEGIPRDGQLELPHPSDEVMEYLQTQGIQLGL